MQIAETLKIRERGPQHGKRFDFAINHLHLNCDQSTQPIDVRAESKQYSGTTIPMSSNSQLSDY